MAREAKKTALSSGETTPPESANYPQPTVGSRPIADLGNVASATGMRAIVLPVVLALSALGSSAHALCIYKGELNAQTTVGREFEDSRWVVKAKVLSATAHFIEGEEPWTEYQLEVRHAYKGDPPRRLRFFTFRNSGGFYLDRGQEHDVGGEYLLFLNPTPRFPHHPAAARGTVSVNYSCGVSGPWSGVSAALGRELLRLGR